MPLACAASSASAISMASDSSVSCGIERPPVDPMLQRDAFQKFHGDERLPVLFANVVDRADVRMIQRGGGLRFALKACQSCGSRTTRRQEISAQRSDAAACLPPYKPRPCRHHRASPECGSARWSGRSESRVRACGAHLRLDAGKSTKRDCLRVKSRLTPLQEK